MSADRTRWVKCRLHNEEGHIIVNLDQVETLRPGMQGTNHYAELTFRSGRTIQVSESETGILDDEGFRSAKS